MPEQFGKVRMGELLEQLCAAFGKPFASNAAKMTEAYHRALADWPIEAVEWAVWHACRDLDRFPRPSKLRELCAKSPHKKAPSRDDLGTAYAAWEVEPWSQEKPYDSLPCPVCGSAYEWTPRGLLIVHSREMHREAGVPFSDAGNPAWRDLPALTDPPRRKTDEPKPAEPPPMTPLAALIPPVAASVHEVLLDEPGDAFEEEA